MATIRSPVRREHEVGTERHCQTLADPLPNLTTKVRTPIVRSNVFLIVSPQILRFVKLLPFV